MNARIGKDSRKQLLSSTGFTLIEMIMTVLIIGLLVVGAAYLMPQVLKNTFYLPNQVQADMVAGTALEIIVEGDQAGHGLRFSKSITTAGANTLVFTDQDGGAMQFRLDTGTGMLYRKIAAGAEALIPYFMPAGMTFAGVGGSLFTYYDASNAVTAVVANIRRVDINLIAQGGTGSFDKMEGYSQQSTSIQVNKYS